MFEASELTAKADSDGDAAGQMAGKHAKLAETEEDKSWGPVRKAPLADQRRKMKPWPVSNPNCRMKRSHLVVPSITDPNLQIFPKISVILKTNIQPTLSTNRAAGEHATSWRHDASLSAKIAEQHELKGDHKWIHTNV